MHENSCHIRDASQTGESRSIFYAYGESPRGDFIAAADKDGLSAILFGDNKADLLNDLRDTLPETSLIRACPTYSDLLVSAVTRLVEHS